MFLWPTSVISDVQNGNTEKKSAKKRLGNRSLSEESAGSQLFLWRARAPIVLKNPSLMGIICEGRWSMPTFSIERPHTENYTCSVADPRGGGGRGFNPPPEVFCFFLLVSIWKFPRTWPLTPPPRRIPRSAPGVYLDDVVKKCQSINRWSHFRIRFLLLVMPWQCAHGVTCHDD